jgi:cell division ATPase FtsA
MLPAHIGYPANLKGITEYASDPTFARAVGLIMLGLNSPNFYHSEKVFSLEPGKISIFKNKILSFFRNLIP